MSMERASRDEAPRLVHPSGELMRMAGLGGTLLTALALAATSPVAANAQLVLDPVLGFHGVLDAVPIGVPERDPRHQATAAATVVYDNTGSPANFGVSSTDPTAVWGDQLLTTDTGLLATHRFTVFNSPTSLGPLLTAQIEVEFLDALSSTTLGGYTVNVNLGGGLAPGVFALLSVSDLEPQLIVLDNSAIIVRQRVVSRTGNATRLGVVSMDPPTVGSSPSSMYIAAATFGDGVPGFYSFTAGPANPGHQLSVSPPPTSTASRSWGELKKLYR